MQLDARHGGARAAAGAERCGAFGRPGERTGCGCRRGGEEGFGAAAHCESQAGRERCTTGDSRSGGDIPAHGVTVYGRQSQRHRVSGGTQGRHLAEGHLGPPAPSRRSGTLRGGGLPWRDDHHRARRVLSDAAGDGVAAVHVHCWWRCRPRSAPRHGPARSVRQEARRPRARPDRYRRIAVDDVRVASSRLCRSRVSANSTSRSPVTERSTAGERRDARRSTRHRSRCSASAAARSSAAYSPSPSPTPTTIGPSFGVQARGTITVAQAELHGDARRGPTPAAPRARGRRRCRGRRARRSVSSVASSTSVSRSADSRTTSLSMCGSTSRGWSPAPVGRRQPDPAPSSPRPARHPAPRSPGRTVRGCWPGR